MSSIDTEREGHEVLEAVERLCAAADSEGGLGAADEADVKAVSDWRGQLASPPEEAMSSSNCNVSSSNCNVTSSNCNES
jgi:hypothetical protein